MSLLQVKEVTHHYTARKLFKSKIQSKQVLSNVSFSIEEGTCLGMLGPSGAGKSTLGKVILGLERPQSGQIFFQGHDLYKADQSIRRKICRDLQAVFQDSYSSVNPRMTAEQIIAEPLENYERLTIAEQKRTIIELLERVGLTEEDLTKYPHQFSGGQLQRINIARAVSLKPKLIVLDESVSSLDMVTQTLILDLLKELKDDFGMSYFFITHDLKAAYHLSDSLGVLDHGQLAGLYEKHRFLKSDHPVVKEMKRSILAEHPRFRSIGTRAVQQ
ncbi:nickel import ATP-binding protein NikE [Bacillus haynesii]|uniref:nickel import ATP-binding protein NikE n=1 Tax=Bacillus haynesii TaxID=1925021 RepID=UPI00227F8157|nr:nickel import ATP-binding protein NikE [Bacillus haynesii]MCY7843224.1 nickel import ATP-binding protein NikE [Bacillus haynesii]MCY8017208.1 nickel import ATP-binding protein NikE [Bacillus haynesii]MCY8214796.1 nickel import ATP-binding protein NikE [Bacillus haynesii]MCY8380421.1 nickel import ATP-binding protein NikE [Bacillus haynesii]MCY8549706.1 nickel import ATP-binding protein NikE [Bacillus haynesii]